MSMQAAQVALFAKLFWIWIGLLISVFVFLNRPGFCRQLRASYFLSNRSPYEQSTLPRRIQDRGGQTNP